MQTPFSQKSDTLTAPATHPPKYFFADADHVGMAASVLCAVHCAAMPFVVTLLPFVGLGFLASEGAEWALLGASFLLGVGSLCWGFRAHRRGRAFLVLSVGFALLALGRVAEAREWGRGGAAFVVLGGVTVARAHFVNRRLCRACRVCHPKMSSDGIF